MKKKNKTKKLFSLFMTAALTFSLALSLSGCSDNSKNTADEAAKNTKDVTIRVGSKDFTEGLIVGEIYALALEDAGFKVERNMNIAGNLIHTAITNDEIDLYPEYTGTGLLNILKMDMESDPDIVYNTVKEEYDKQFQLTWLDSSAVNDTQGLAIRTQTAQKYNIHTISDLQKNASNIRFCSQGEFEYREDGIAGLEKLYGDFNFKSINVYDSGLKYQILDNDEADICAAYSTDASLVHKDKFLYLEDDKNFWPPYYMAPVVRNNVLEENPEIAEVLNKVNAKLDTETMISLNAKVDIDKEEYEETAKEFFDSIK